MDNFRFIYSRELIEELFNYSPFTPPPANHNVSGPRPVSILARIQGAVYNKLPTADQLRVLKFYNEFMNATDIDYKEYGS